MKVIGNQGPGVANRGGIGENPRLANKEIVVIVITGKNSPTLKATANDVAQQSGGVDAGLAGHEGSVTENEVKGNNL